VPVETNTVVQVGTTLVALVRALAEYKRTRDDAKAKGEVVDSDGVVMSDAALVGLFKTEAVQLEANATALLLKYPEIDGGATAAAQPAAAPDTPSDDKAQ
jgi:hypothetical protein